MSKNWIWQLEFEDARGMERAFRALMEADDLGDCSALPADRLIRFTASVDRGDALVARIYQMGELRWCSRHRLLSRDTPAAASRAS